MTLEVAPGVVDSYPVSVVAWSPSLHHFLFAAKSPYQVEALFLVTAPEPGSAVGALAALACVVAIRRRHD
jgi:MYXO-CTERM domain-containing protein